MDQLYEILFLGGLAVAAVGWIWLVIVAFRTSKTWGFLHLVAPPAALIFIPKHWSRTRAPLGVILAGLVLSSAPAVYTRVAPVDLGPLVKTVDGETHITLTGWDRQDYSALRQWPDVDLLQMANADVTDATLRLLESCPKLRELDVSDSQVTDAGLAVVAKLPLLENLRLKNCRITDVGFRNHLLPHPKLRQLELSGTQVTPEVIREWRKANPERRAMR
jgi:Leucine-rich repeat (LRR) protein